MAGSVSDATAGFLLENLKELVQNNADLLAGAEAAANKLCDDLLLLKGYFKQCTEEYSGNDHILQALDKDIRKLVYRAEDTIETYIANPSSKQKNRGATKGALYTIDHAMELRKDLEAMMREAEGIMRDVQELLKNKKTGFGSQAIKLERGHVERVKKVRVPFQIFSLGHFPDRTIFQKVVL